MIGIFAQGTTVPDGRGRPLTVACRDRAIFDGWRRFDGVLDVAAVAAAFVLLRARLAAGWGCWCFCRHIEWGLGRIAGSWLYVQWLITGILKFSGASIWGLPPI